MKTINASLPIDAARRRATHWRDLMTEETAARIRGRILRAHLAALETDHAGDAARIAAVRGFLADPLIAAHCPADLALAKRRAVALAIVDAPGGEIDHA